MNISRAKNCRDKVILYLTPLPPPSGGISTWSSMLLKYGLPQGYSFLVVNTSTLSGRNTHVQAKFNFRELKRNILIIYNLIKILILKQPDIVHINCCLAPVGVFREFICALIVKKTKTKVVTHYRGNIGDFSHTKFMGVSFRLLLVLLKISNINLTLNDFSLDFAKSYLPIKKRKSVYKVANYIDDYHFCNGDTAIKCIKKNTRLRVIYVGSLSISKGAHDFIRIAKIFPKLNFIMVGNVVPEFESYLLDVPDNLTIIGPISHEEVLMELKKSNILLFLSYSEGFPNVVLESMAMGLAVVATRVGSIPEMIKEGSGGFLCDVGDFHQIVAAMEKTTLMTTTEISKMGWFNFRKARDNFSYSAVIKRLCQIYDKL